MLLLCPHLFFIFFSGSVYLSVVRPALWNTWFRLHYHYSTSSLHSLLFFSSLPCFALSPPGWLLYQARQKLILEFCPWFPPLSPWAVTCQSCPPLGAPSCYNYLWHQDSGASTQVTRWRGWARTVERRKGRFFLCSRQGDVRIAAACYCWSQNKTIQPCLYRHLKRPLH